MTPADGRSAGDRSAGDRPVPRGLPGALPEGESILWQGSPEAHAFARDVLHGRLICLYFAAAAIFVAGLQASQARPPASIAISLGLVGAACLAVLVLLRGYAALVARSSVYTITTRRTVMRIGVAWPVTLNLPHAEVLGAGLRTRPDGTGDLPIALGGPGRIAYLVLWPHARPWCLGRPEPMLRAVPDAAQVATILARTLGAGPLGRAAAARAGTASAPAGGALPSRAA